MKLYEFFSVPQSDEEKDPRDRVWGKTADEEQKLADEVYWFILDDDRLHKECFMPLAHEVSEKMKDKTFDRGEFTKKWMPMVNKGCLKFYKTHEMTEDPKDVFSKEMRKALCQRFADEHHPAIEKGEYKLK